MEVKLIFHPHEGLRKKAEKVKNFDEDFHVLLREMKAILKKKQGLGLAAPQVNRNLQCFLVRDENKVRVFVNPEILAMGEKTVLYEEGCLSIPGVYAEIERPVSVRIRAQDSKGQFFELENEGILARIIFHEYDHLQGKLFIDYLPKNMRKKLLEEYNRLRQQSGENTEL